MMGDTYDSAADAEADREQQRQLLAALNAWDRALRRDECGMWTIQGARGTIHAYGDGKSWIMYVACRSDRHWSWVKKALAFCRVALDCEEPSGCSSCRRPRRQPSFGRNWASARSRRFPIR